MTAAANPRLVALLGGEALAGLRARLRRAYARIPTNRPQTGFTINDLRPEEYDALVSIIGLTNRAGSAIRLEIARADAAFSRAGLAPSLRDALELLDGPIQNAGEERARRTEAWALMAGSIENEEVRDFVRTPSGLRILRRVAKQDTQSAAAICVSAGVVIAQLPARGIPRSRLSAAFLGDAHALDNGKPVASLVIALLEARRASAHPSEPSLEEDSAAAVGATERIRDIWADAGVLVNELARPALTLNLPFAAAPTPNGEPIYFSLRQLLRRDISWAVAGASVYVCENPNLVAMAADQFGPACKPLVCTDGMPAAAQRTLLDQLRDRGARLLYHGDFDWPGIRIGNLMMARFLCEPWRFSVADYASAVKSASRLTHPLDAGKTEASWDSELASAMQDHRIALAEEAVAEELFSDLLATYLRR